MKPGCCTAPRKRDHQYSFHDFHHYKFWLIFLTNHKQSALSDSLQPSPCFLQRTCLDQYPHYSLLVPLLQDQSCLSVPWKEN